MPKHAHSRSLRHGRFSKISQIYLLTTVTQNRHPLFNDWHLGRLVVAEEVPTGKNQPDGRPERLGHPTLVDGKLARIGGEIKPSVRRDY